MKTTCKRLVATALALLTALSVIVPVAMPTVSAMDQAEYEQKTYYKNGASPMAAAPTTVTLTKGTPSQREENYTLSLDGTWKMTSSGKIADLAAGRGWNKAYDATVPGSIYTALVEAGVIDDPYVGDNMKKANKQSEKNWYFLRTFTYEGKGERVELDFEGLCNVADIYLNGKKIASHEGMFGGPFVDVTDTIKKGENTLVIHLYPAKDYTKTVVFNCSYGWHYAKLYPLGIWQSVTVRDVPTVTLDSPFITTVDHTKGTVDLAIELDKQSGSTLAGELTVSFTPKNFTGTSSYFTKTVSAGSVDSTTLRYRCDIPNFKLWWPNGYGEQNLYVMKVTFKASDGAVSYAESTFGIRTLDYKALPVGETAGGYNRVVVINGKDIYMKGAGWCTLDSMMEFSREDYDRVLSRAHDAGINFFRAWGGGLVETDEFYDLCDEYGICVYQEWPCCWDSTNTQPADVLYETVILGAKRLRNRASLVVWGGGNEGNAPYTDKVLNNMGKLTYETDGTRDFWRQDGGTGSANIVHNHIWWSGDSPEYYIKNYANKLNYNFHEYGLGAMMNMDSIAKYATAEEMAEWPINRRGTIAYHTATFNGSEGWTPTPWGYDIDTHIHYASFFLQTDSLEDLVRGSQLSQAQADYLPAINARINNPYSSMNVVYKLNDNYPGASWSIVDWYGAPKIAYYMMQDAYRTLMAGPKTDHYNTFNAMGESQALTLPVHVLDDLDELKGKSWSVKVTAYGEDLSVVKTQTFDGKGSVNTVGKAGDFTLTAEQTYHTPLIIAFDLYVGGQYVNRTFVYFNYEYEQGSLFYLPRTSLSYSVSGNTVTVKNTGDLPAVGVELLTSDTSKFVTEDNFFLLAAGETVTLTVNDGSMVEGVTCFNFKDTADKVAPTTPDGLKVKDVAFDGATLSWNPSQDEGGLFGYYVTFTDADGKSITRFVQDCNTSLTMQGLTEVTTYTFTVKAVDNNGNESEISAKKTFTTFPDRRMPTLLTADFGDGNTIILTFNTPMDKTRAEDPAYYMLNHGATVKSAALSDDGITVTLTCEGLDTSKAYTVGVIGLTDTKYVKNSIGYAQALVERDLYIAVDFEVDENGRTYSSGAFSGVLETISGIPSFTDRGQSGMALSSGTGLQLKDVPFTFNEGTSIVMWVNGKASSGYNVLLAKGPKSSGHFEFYARDGMLFMYAPDIGDKDLGFDINTLGSGWHQLAFIWTSSQITVYADGQIVGGCTVNGDIRETVDTMSFGSLNDGSLTFGGTLDTVRLYNRVLAPEELTVPKGSSECGIRVESPLITLLPGENAPLGITALGSTVFKLTTVGDSVTLADGVLTANELGETLIYAVSEDGAYIGGVVVQVVESLPEDTTEEETDPPVEPDTLPTDTTAEAETPAETPDGSADTTDETQPPKKKGCRSSLGLTALLTVTLCGGWLALSKKHR